MDVGEKQKRPKAGKLSDQEACPFLGLDQDSSTWLAYPHPANFCHRASPAANLNLSYQESTCLTRKHAACLGFTRGWNGALPETVRGEPAVKPLAKSLVLPAMIGLALLVLLAGWQLMRRGRLSFMGGEDTTPTILVTSIGSSQVSGLVVLSPTSTITPAPPPTETPNRPKTQTALASLNSPTPTTPPTSAITPTLAPPTPGPAFKTPFGPGEKFLLHQLEAGESLGTLVTLYDTTNQVITASNLLVEGASIWPGTVLVIIPGEKDPSAVSRFRVVLLESATSVDDLAAEFEISVEDLRMYNSLGADRFIPAGRYLIIPVE